jgi:hypothetical protein
MSPNQFQLRRTGEGADGLHRVPSPEQFVSHAYGLAGSCAPWGRGRFSPLAGAGCDADRQLYHFHRGSGSVGLGKAPAAWVGKCCRLSGKRSPRTVDLLVRPDLTGAAPTASFFHSLRDLGPFTLWRDGGRGYLPSRNVFGRHLQFQLADHAPRKLIDPLPSHNALSSCAVAVEGNRTTRGKGRVPKLSGGSPKQAGELPNVR